MESRDGKSDGEWSAAGLERRRFLRGLGAAGVATIGAPTGILAACTASSDAPPGALGTGTTSGTGPAPATRDPSRPYWLQGNFAPVSTEVEAFDLAVTGSIPPELTGVFVRNGSNPVTGESSHWFVGDGMLHGIRLEKGKARWYRNRYVRTPMYDTRTGLLGGAPPGRENNQSNVSAFLHAGKLLTSGEVGWPYEIAPDDLNTVGAYDFGGKLQTAMTAHPKIDPATGKMHFFGYGFVAPFLTYHVVAADGTLEYSAEVAVKGSTMIHDFAITDRDVVFWEGPVVFSLDMAVEAAKTGKSVFPFKWDPSYGSRVGIMPLGGPTTEIRWVEMDPCYVFHGTNAFRDGDDIVIDLCKLPEAFSATGDLPTSTPHRWTVDTSGPALRLSERQHVAATMDLPNIDRRQVGRPYRHGWYVAVDWRGPEDFEFAGINHFDHTAGTMDAWDPGPSRRAGEGIFVPGGAGEGEGWILTYAFDKARNGSDFLVFDALSMANGPIATVALPQRVPYGFHGVWVPDT